MDKLIRPHDLAQALDLLSENKMLVFAGGTDLMIRHRATAGTLPDFKQNVLYIADLNELKTIRINSKFLEIGACVTMAEILAHPELPDTIKAPFVQVGSVVIRNKATLGGNIVNASPAGDTLGMLYALDAKVITRSKLHGEVRIPIENFILGPRRTTLKDDELVIGIEIPVQPVTSFVFKKVGSRAANAISKLSFYGASVYYGKQLVDVRIAFGAMGPTIIRHRQAELLLVNTDPNLRSKEALHLYEALLSPIDDLRSSKHYRKQVALNLLTDFIERELNR
jgi:CO/xanthine dehydrogenase FAD-binding subunit